MKLALVVGANGFLGNLMVEKLLLNDVKVVAVYNSNFDNINKKATIYKNEELLKEGLQPDFIFFTSGNYATPYPQLMEINRMLDNYTEEFPDAKMVYISSANVYGDTKDSITEKSPFTNPGTYAMSKLSGEFIVASMKNYSIIRLAYVYGPKITNKSFIPSLIKSAKENNTIELFGNGEREQDYIYVEDAIELCFLSAFEKDNLVYLGATGKSISNLEVANEIKKHIDCEIKFSGTETGQSFYFDATTTFTILNWKPQTSFSQGIKNMVS
jgi:UDP-glucose 4-epimerase